MGAARTWVAGVLGCALLAGCATTIDGRAVSAPAPATPAPTASMPVVPTTPPTTSPPSPAPSAPTPPTPTVDLSEGTTCLEIITVVPPVVDAINAYAAVGTAEEAAAQAGPTRDAIATAIGGLQELAANDPPPSPELVSLTNGMADSLDRLSAALETDADAANAAIDEFNAGYEGAQEICTS